MVSLLQLLQEAKPSPHRYRRTLPIVFYSSICPTSVYGECAGLKSSLNKLIIQFPNSARVAVFASSQFQLQIPEPFVGHLIWIYLSHNNGCIVKMITWDWTFEMHIIVHPFYRFVMTWGWLINSKANLLIFQSLFKSSKCIQTPLVILITYFSLVIFMR